MADVLVLGAGVIGLTTGIRLAEDGHRVRIRSAHEPLATTSALATAMIGPTFAPPEAPERRWEATTVAELTGSPEMPGVHLCHGRLIARPPDMTPPLADEIPGFAPCTAGELPPGYQTGFWVTLPLIDMEPYLAHLRQRFLGAGGELEIRPVGSLVEAAGECRRLVNCTGLAARHLVPDQQVTPVRGVKLVVENPGLTTFLMEAPLSSTWAGLHPHGDHVVIGGVAEEGAESAAPDADEAATMLQRCVEIEPRLADAPIIEHRVGARPGRPTIRLEAEVIEGARCVHNYGHGGIGVTMAWGCAEDAAALVTG